MSGTIPVGPDVPVPANSVAAALALTPNVAGAVKDTGPTPLIATSNIFGSPSSTIAGVGIIAMGASQYLSQMGTPTTSVGWFTFGVTMLSGVAAMLAKGGSTIR